MKMGGPWLALLQDVWILDRAVALWVAFAHVTR